MIYRGTRRVPSAHAVNLAFERLGGLALRVDAGRPRHLLAVACRPSRSTRRARSSARCCRSRRSSTSTSSAASCSRRSSRTSTTRAARSTPTTCRARSSTRDHPLGLHHHRRRGARAPFDEAMLRRHHERHYTARQRRPRRSPAPSTRTRAMRLAERDFGAPAARRRASTADAPAHAQKKPRLQIVENVSSQTELRVCFRALAESAPAAPGARRAHAPHRRRDVDAPLPPPLRRARASATTCRAGYDGYEDDGVIDVAAGVQHKRAALVTREILAMFEELAREGPTAEELEKARRRIAWDAPRDGRLGRGGRRRSSRAALLFDRVRDAGRARGGAGPRRAPTRCARRRARIARPERLNVVAVGLLEDGEDERLERGRRRAGPARAEALSRSRPPSRAEPSRRSLARGRSPRRS